MTLRLVERLNTMRQHYFVGRKQECDLFQAALASPELPFSILYFFGAGGVGKTTLLWRFTQICHAANIPVTYLDGKTFEASPRSFLNELPSGIHLMSNEATSRWRHRETSTRILADQSTRSVLLIDSFDRIAALEDWLRKEFLPQLPEHVLVVLAGRCSPSATWRTDPGWHSVFHALTLQNLSLEESQLYLQKRSIASSHHAAIVDFTHGHPLALSLMTDSYSNNQSIAMTSDATSNVIKTLLETFLEEVPSSTHRMALEACSIVRLTTEALLAELLELPDVHDLFEWLRELSFVEVGAFGLKPHDLVREVIVSDLRWRNPDRWMTLRERSRNYYSTRLDQTQGQEQHQILWDLLFLHQHQSVVKSRFVWQPESSLMTDTLLYVDDHAAILDMVTRHEGELAARIAAHWLRRQPENVLVVRDRQAQVSGFLTVVALHQANEADLHTDPAALSAWQYLKTHAPLRAGEGALLYRFWMAQDTYQAISPTQTLIFINAVQHYRNTAGIAFSFFSCSDPELWAPFFDYTGFSNYAEANFKMNGQHYSVYGHDWRVVSPSMWWEQLGQRQLNVLPTRSLNSEEIPLVLSQTEFAQAVRDALRHFVRPDALHHNPLLRSRLVRSAIPSSVGNSLEGLSCINRESQIAVLQAQLREATELLQASPRDEKLYRTLHRTYLHPALTQEQAAELLDLPFSTYRRYLKAGVARVADILWQRELRSA